MSCCNLPLTKDADQVKRDTLPQRSSSQQADACLIPGGRTEVGTDSPFFAADGEGPRRIVKIKSFGLEPCTVTNERFAVFVRDTGYITDAEHYGWSFVFYQHIASDEKEFQAVVGAEWWRKVPGATWRAPNGPNSDWQEIPDHPVVHVSFNDAQAFARWAGGRLPTEAEWEHAARGGQQGALFPWGDRLPDDHEFTPCNIWQGDFPKQNLAIDGYTGTAPALSFEPNAYGLYNMSGNVWEWVDSPFIVRSLKKFARNKNNETKKESTRVLKGGSFLCHHSYCYRYRIAARIGNPPSTGTSHVGFRIAYD